MKAITLHQPWATFIAEGWKTLETRSWATYYRGRIAIHAAKAPHREDEARFHTKGLLPDEIRRVLPPPGEYAYGKIVAIATLAGCWTILPEHQNRRITELEFIMGDWGPGRCAWKLERVHALDPPVPARGRQGLWNWYEGTA